MTFTIAASMRVVVASKAALLVVCVGLSPACRAAPPLSHDVDIQPLWDAKCSDCHMDGLAFGGLFLDRGHAHANLVGVHASQLRTMSRVEPGAPARSYLWLKLEGEHEAAGGYGEQIPVLWTDEERTRIRRWIEQGAHP